MLDGIKFIIKNNRVKKIIHNTFDECKVLVKMTDGTEKIVSGREWLSMGCHLIKSFSILGQPQTEMMGGQTDEKVYHTSSCSLAMVGLNDTTILYIKINSR